MQSRQRVYTSISIPQVSRFARNTVDLLETVRHLKDIGVDVWFEEEGIHSMDGDGELMLTILASFAQEESRSISENCKWGIRKREFDRFIKALEKLPETVTEFDEAM